MKRFSFKYERVLEYRERIEQEEKEKLGSLMAEKARIQKEIEKIRNIQAAMLDEINTIFSLSGSVNQVMQAREYIRSLETDITENEAKIEVLLGKIEKQKAVLARAKQEVDIMQKLKDKHFDEYRYEANRQEQKFNDEMAAKAKSVLKQPQNTTDKKEAV